MDSVRPYRFGLHQDTSIDEPSNWQSHLKDLDWKANIKALEIELNSRYNDGWWKDPTPQVIVEWPTMRKWAAQTLKDCLTSSWKSSGRNISKADKGAFLQLFRRCPVENLNFLVFAAPMTSLVENIESVQAGQQLRQIPEESESLMDDNTARGGTVDSEQIWSVSACNVDTLPLGRHGDGDDLEPIGESVLDWEPPELKQLDWRANMEALTLTIQLPLNQEWDREFALYVKDAALRHWASETMINCIEERHSLTATQRQDFLELFEKLPRSYLRSLSFLNPVTVAENMKVPKEQASPNSLVNEESEDDSETSVYL